MYLLILIMLQQPPCSPCESTHFPVEALSPDAWEGFCPLRFHCSLSPDKHFTRRAVSEMTHKLRQRLLSFHFSQKKKGHKTHTIRGLFLSQSLISPWLYKIIYICHKLPLSPFSLLSTTNDSLTALTTLPACSWVSLKSKRFIILYPLNRNKPCFLLFVAACLDEKPALLTQGFFEL